MSTTVIMHRLTCCVTNPETEAILQEDANVIQLPRDFPLCSLFQPNKRGTFSRKKQPEGEMNQRDVDLICLKQETSAHKNVGLKRLCYVTGEGCRRLRHKTILGSPCEILNTADTTGRRRGGIKSQKCNPPLQRASKNHAHINSALGKALSQTSFLL